jgi:hypothetical protein
VNFSLCFPGSVLYSEHNRAVLGHRPSLFLFFVRHREPVRERRAFAFRCWHGSRNSFTDELLERNGLSIATKAAHFYIVTQRCARRTGASLRGRSAAPNQVSRVHTIGSDIVGRRAHAGDGLLSGSDSPAFRKRHRYLCALGENRHKAAAGLQTHGWVGSHGHGVGV